MKLKITHPKADLIEFPESVFIEINKKPIPFFFSSFNPQNNGFAIIEFDGISTEQETKNLSGNLVYLPASLEPQPEGKEFYIDEIIGFQVVDIHLGPLGTVSNVMEAPANDVFEIDHPSGKELLIPVLDNFIVEVDRKNQTLRLEAPEDLVHFYLQE